MKLQLQIIRKLRQKDCLGPRVWNQPGQHNRKPKTGIKPLNLVRDEAERKDIIKGGVWVRYRNRKRERVCHGKEEEGEMRVTVCGHRWSPFLKLHTDSECSGQHVTSSVYQWFQISSCRGRLHCKTEIVLNRKYINIGEFRKLSLMLLQNILFIVIFLF